MEDKVCGKCGVVLDDSNWNVSYQKIANCICKKCVRERNKKWYEENSEKVKASSKKCLCGITQEDFEQMKEDQNNCCAICKQPFIKTPHIDHNHTTGKVRGLLCNGCNIKVGCEESPLHPAVVHYLEDFYYGLSD